MTATATLPAIQFSISDVDLQRAAAIGAEIGYRRAREEFERRLAEVAPQFMSAHEAAAMVGGDCSIKTIYKWAAQGHFRTFHPTARVTRYLRSEVLAFMESGLSQ